MKKRIVSGIAVTLLLTSMLTLSLNVKSADAYKSGTDGTHEFIFKQARTILRNDGFVSFADFLDSPDPANPGFTYLQTIVLGSYQNDDELLECRKHYHDPMDHTGLYWGGSYHDDAAALCQSIFDEAVSYWSSHNYHQAMYDLGWAAHLVQDLCVPHHAIPMSWSPAGDPHSHYESWVNDNKSSFAVDSGGIYSFSSFPDYQYYITGDTQHQHYSWDNVSAYDWVDYNAHESDKYSLYVDEKSNENVTDSDPSGGWDGWNTYVQTVHPLPDNLETTFEITKYQASRIRLEFLELRMELGHDFVDIYDKNNNLLLGYSGNFSTSFWTPWCTGDTIKVKVRTNGSVPSWGYKIISAKFSDTGEDDLQGATSVLLPRAQRTTAGFIKFFFDKVLNTVQIKADGSIEPSSAPIQRTGNTYTFTGNMSEPLVVERDNIVINGKGYALQGIHNVSDGLYVSNRNNVTIQNTTITGFWTGVFLLNSTNIHVDYGNVSLNKWNGIGLHNSPNNTICQSKIQSNGAAGIWLTDSSSKNTISENELFSNRYNGIYVRLSSDNLIYMNKIKSNGNGIRLGSYSFNNTISENNITTNGRNLYIDYSSGNQIYHNNLVGGYLQVITIDSVNMWNRTYPSGGNYWSDYLGTDTHWGLRQNEAGSDGIGDSPYVIDANNRDRYPLMSPYERTVISVVNEITMENTFTFYTESTSTETRFNATVWVNDVSNLAGYQVDLNIDDTMLNITRAWLPVCDPKWVFAGKTTLKPQPAFHDWDFDGSMDDVWVGDVIFAGGTFSGTGKLAVIELEIVKRPPAGGRLPALLNISGVDTYLLDSKAAEIAGTKISGYYEYIGSPPKISVVNPATMDNNFIFYTNMTSVGSRFNATVWVNEGTDVVAHQVDIRYNSSVLNATHAWLPTTDTSYIFYGISTFPTSYFYVGGVKTDDVTIPVTGVSFTTPKKLAIIEFEIISAPSNGSVSCNLDINSIDTYLLDPDINEIPTTKINGFYKYVALHDVATVDVEPWKTVIGQTFTSKINVTVTNEGDFSETLNITVYANSTFIASQTVFLSSGNFTTIVFVWNTTGFAKGNYTISAYAWPVPGETDVADNTFVGGWVIVATVADITGPTQNIPDGKVDIRDLALIAKHYGHLPPDGHSPGTTDYIACFNADITGPTTGVPDNKIDIRDLALAAKNYGKIDP